eukprot:2714755-Pyramimonas_sp.AAC.2
MLQLDPERRDDEEVVGRAMRATERGQRGGGLGVRDEGPVAGRLGYLQDHLLAKLHLPWRRQRRVVVQQPLEVRRSEDAPGGPLSTARLEPSLSELHLVRRVIADGHASCNLWRASGRGIRRGLRGDPARPADPRPVENRSGIRMPVVVGWLFG